MPHLSSCPERSLCRSNAHLHHIASSAAGISGQERSTTELQRLSKRCHWWGSNPRPK